jgi:hypothetical protein
MLLALMGGRALTATELAVEADVAASTASSHLARLTEAKLIRLTRQGRHRYFALADASVAALIESLGGVASRDGATRVTTGPADPDLRHARVCYDHLAGEVAVALVDSLVEAQWLEGRSEAFVVTAAGRSGLSGIGIDMKKLETSRRPLARACLDWSERRPHLAGSLGAAILTLTLEKGWASRDLVGRAVRFTPAGLRQIRKSFGLRSAA